MNILFFNANWCNSCHQMQPIIEKVAKEHGISLELCDVDEDSRRDDYLIRSVPTTVVEHEGKEVRLFGFHPESDIIKALNDVYISG